jgi:hypothetical protein
MARGAREKARARARARARAKAKQGEDGGGGGRTSAQGRGTADWLGLDLSVEMVLESSFSPRVVLVNDQEEQVEQEQTASRRGASFHLNNTVIGPGRSVGSQPD